MFLSNSRNFYAPVNFDKALSRVATHAFRLLSAKLRKTNRTPNFCIWQTMSEDFSWAKISSATSKIHGLENRLYGCFKLVHFSKKSSRLSSAGPKMLAFVARRTFNRFWIDLHQTKRRSCKYSRFQLTSNQMSDVFSFEDTRYTEDHCHLLKSQHLRL